MMQLGMPVWRDLYVVEGKEAIPVWKFVCRYFDAQ